MGNVMDTRMRADPAVLRKTSLIIIDQHRLFREGLTTLCKAMGHTIRLSAENGDDLGETLIDDHVLFLIGAKSADEDLRSTIAHLRKIAPLSLIVFLADKLNTSQMERAVSAGANGFLPKDISSEVLEQNIKLVLLGETAFSPDTLHGQGVGSQTHDTPPEFTTLSLREGEIIRFLVDGKSNKYISRSLHISEATVKVHLKSILRKLRVSNRTQAAVWALSNGVISAGILTAQLQ